MIQATINFVKKELANAEGGHDWWHILRVWNSAKTIAREEKAEMLVVELAALLHDIADAKFNNGDEEIGPQKARDFMLSQNVDEETVNHVVSIIENMSFKNSLGKVKFSSPEMLVVQDADRLDAIGAIGIARCFNYGGFKNNIIYSPDLPPQLNMSKEEYKASNGSSINHFYEKLLLLKNKMNTKKGMQLAAQRHQFMEQYLEQFYAEFKGECY
ncbi:MAG: HD domain-containing protein [Flavobacteriales bacterium]|nr:HD domain-containing protein [Flavobacteriales bacterium]